MLHILQVQYQFFSRPDNNLGLTRKSYWEARDMTKRKVENPKKKKLYEPGQLPRMKGLLSIGYAERSSWKGCAAGQSDKGQRWKCANE